MGINTRVTACYHSKLSKSVVGQFFPWFKFYFPLFWGMVMMIMSFKQRKIKFKPRKKLNHNKFTLKFYTASLTWEMPSTMVCVTTPCVLGFKGTQNYYSMPVIHAYSLWRDLSQWDKQASNVRSEDCLPTFKVISPNFLLWNSSYYVVTK